MQLRVSRQRWLLWGALVPVVLGAAIFTIAGFVEARASDAPVEETHVEATPVATPTPPLPTDFEPYIRRPNGSRADPVNLIFRGQNADGVATAIAQVLGWRFVVGGPMTFRARGAEYATAWQMGIDLGSGSRMHIRIQAMPGEAEPGFVLAAVHRDDTVPCGHVGRAFDEARDLVARAFAAAGYRVSRLHLENTQVGRHCDGTENAGDGHAVIIDLNLGQ